MWKIVVALNMVRFCCICKIEYGVIGDVSIHTIPKSKELQAKWFLNIGRSVNKYSGVCSKHFEAKDFQYRVVGNIVKRFLVPEAVPTLLLTQSNRENISNNNIEVITNSSQRDNSHTTLADVSYCCVEVTESENECNNDMKQKTGSKRKSNKPMKNAKRLCNPRYIGDLRREDFTSETSWRIVREHVKICKSRCKVLNQIVTRRNEKIENFKSLLDHLKKNNLLSNEDCNALEVSG